MVDESWNAEFLAKANQAKEITLRCNDEELKENWNRIAMAYWGISQDPFAQTFCAECGGAISGMTAAVLLSFAKNAERSVRKANAVSENQSWRMIAAEYRYLAGLSQTGRSQGVSRVFSSIRGWSGKRKLSDPLNAAKSAFTPLPNEP